MYSAFNKYWKIGHPYKKKDLYLNFKPYTKINLNGSLIDLNVKCKVIQLLREKIWEKAASWIGIIQSFLDMTPKH